MQTETLDLRKEMIIDLTKKKNIEGQKAQVIFVCDYSGSMSHEYRSGLVQSIVERLFPLALAFDNDGKMDMYLFENSYRELPEITTANYKGYIQREVIDKRFHMGGTSYAPIIKKLTNDVTTAGGFLGKMLGRTSNKELDMPLFVIFITDGNNDDKRDTTEAMQEASKHGIFWQFVGIGDEDFPFLQKLDDLSGRLIDNASFFHAENIDKLSDTELYNALLGEFPVWTKQARAHNLIR
jgi:vWA found in TerF C terminus